VNLREVKRYYADEIGETWADTQLVSASDYDRLLADTARREREAFVQGYLLRARGSGDVSGHTYNAAEAEAARRYPEGGKR
jgi:hypothetical protein